MTFLWHFHQPNYWDPIRKIEAMPWARLHSIKGYSDMASILESHPDIKVTVNLVPSLLDRWAELKEQPFRDEGYRFASIPAEELEPQDKEYLLTRCFQANWETMIQPNPRYHQLLVKRGQRLTPDRLATAVKDFTVAELRDLQVWFDLSWFGFSACQRFEEIRELRQRDRHFSEDDKQAIWDLQRKLIAELIPKYRSLWEQKRIEISTSPYYHPILPLLVDSDCAKDGLPNEPMPSEHFRAPEDAEMQLERAAKRVEELMGRTPVGLWPSEGSVSTEALQLASETGFQWTASDEAVLFKTLRCKRSTSKLYQPYRLDVDPPLSMIFRDHGLSDAIGFRYSRMPAKRAVREFMGHLTRIEREFRGNDEPLVSVILDGENPWEYFLDGGKEFLDLLYSELAANPSITAVTPQEYLAEHPPQQRLKSIFPGSWINGNFQVWIGDQESNLGWDLLAKARQELVNAEGDNDDGSQRYPQAWEALYRAEGSDWFWWFGDIHSSENDAEFDRLFRNNLREIYQMLSKEVPTDLDHPIVKTPFLERRIQPAFAMTPVLDGKVTSYYEWLGACKFDVEFSGGTMNLPNARTQKIFYGFNDGTLHFRVDFRQDGEPNLPTIQFQFNLDPKVQLVIGNQSNGKCQVKIKSSSGDWRVKNTCGQFVWDDILEIQVPFDCIGVSLGQELAFYLQVLKQGNVVERWPIDGVIQFHLPTMEEIAACWSV